MSGCPLCGLCFPSSGIIAHIELSHIGRDSATWDCAQCCFRVTPTPVSFPNSPACTALITGRQLRGGFHPLPVDEPRPAAGSTAARPPSNQSPRMPRPNHGHLARLRHSSIQQMPSYSYRPSVTSCHSRTLLSGPASPVCQARPTDADPDECQAGRQLLRIANLR